MLEGDDVAPWMHAGSLPALSLLPSTVHGDMQAPKVQQTKEAKALAAANSSKGKKKVSASGRFQQAGWNEEGRLDGLYPWI